MRASLVIVNRVDETSLRRTLEACAASLAGIDHEILVAPGVQAQSAATVAAKQVPSTATVWPTIARDGPAARHSCARAARGDVLVLLEGDTKPEGRALARLVQAVEASSGATLAIPQLATLDSVHWRTTTAARFHGRVLDLKTLESRSLTAAELLSHAHRPMVSSPAVWGAALAISRTTYEALGGLDGQMRNADVAYLDLSLKACLSGYSIGLDSTALVAHASPVSQGPQRPGEQTVADQLRLAYKNFSTSVFDEWVAAARTRHQNAADGGAGRWAHAWSLFMTQRVSALEERRALSTSRRHDELWFARRFALSWPALAGTASGRGAVPLAPSPKPSQKPSSGPTPTPSPAPGGWGTWFLFGGPGGNAC